MKRYISNSVEDTLDVAKKIMNHTQTPAIILLNGDLGAGKTHFVKGIALAYGCNDSVTSPTFTIMNEYLSGKCPIYHFDMYRLSSDEDARNLGFEEFFDLSTLNGVSVVEWPENTQGLFPKEAINITILKGAKDNQRIIEVRGEKC